MADVVIITGPRYHDDGSDLVRWNPAAGVLTVAAWDGDSWESLIGYGEPGNANNEFRIIVDNPNWKVQQIKDGGSWSGSEGVDFITVGQL